MKGKQIAIYARVSSEQQAHAGTIESQLAALKERVAADGFELPTECEFVDDGYSGATLVRPGLERLRDLAAAGGLDRLYVHSPDRLARKYAYQILVVDELHRAGVEVVFLNRALGETPEDELLLQVQGMVAEYEGAKILERSRRGKLHAAARGSISVLSTAPYGYRYIAKRDGDGEARLEIVAEEAHVVAKIFDWVGRQRATIGEVCRRLRQAGECSRSGKTWWDRTTLWGMLKNPAYMGRAAFGKTRVGPMRGRLRPPRGACEQPRRAYSAYDVPSDQWISVPVPAIVSGDLFEAVAEQLRENQRRARGRNRGQRYLLQGLLTCQRCGYAYTGRAISGKAARGRRRNYAYYRCIGGDASRFGGHRVCPNKAVRTDLLEAAVWGEVRSLLEDPQRLEEEYRRRLTRSSRALGTYDAAQVGIEVSKLRRGIARMIDSYAAGLIEKDEFEPRIKRAKERVAKLEEHMMQLVDEASLKTQLELIIGKLDDFAAKVKEGLNKPDCSTRRELIRALVRRIEVGEEQVNVVFRVDPGSLAQGTDGNFLQHCWRRVGPVVDNPTAAPARTYHATSHDTSPTDSSEEPVKQAYLFVRRALNLLH